MLGSGYVPLFDAKVSQGSYLIEPKKLAAGKNTLQRRLFLWYVVGLKKGGYMKNLIKIGALVLVIVLPTMCQAGSKLSTDEAKKIIEQESGYPKLYVGIGDYPPGRPLTSHLRAYLTKEGYVTRGKYYTELTEKGKKKFEMIDSDFGRLGSCYALYTHQEYIKSIDEILIDEKKDIASVKYTIGFKQLPLGDFLTQWNNIYQKHGRNSIIIKDPPPSQSKIILKKYDKGWRKPQM
jgi:hypothetical protein